ncbi:MAG TPA: pteridine reductase [Gammaproteobacteria bacterium]|nr:pteridine reductase [Gammaproteobacteria bacterium]
MPMENHNRKLAGRTALVTGAAKRLGAAIARALHAEGMNLLLHYNTSEADAQALCKELNAARADSAAVAQADLANVAGLESLVKTALQWDGLDVLVNNASTFKPTPLGQVGEDDWDELMASNLKAPFFLAQAAAVHLRKNHGSIVNLVDIHARRPLRDHAVYCAAKAGLAMLTLSLARDLGPEVRVNGVAPGPVLWPEQGLDAALKKSILEATALKRKGSPEDVAGAVLYLVRDAGYVTGQIIAVDGGRSIGW